MAVCMTNGLQSPGRPGPGNKYGECTAGLGVTYLDADDDLPALMVPIPTVHALQLFLPTGSESPFLPDGITMRSHSGGFHLLGSGVCGVLRRVRSTLGSRVLYGLLKRSKM